MVIENPLEIIPIDMLHLCFNQLEKDKERRGIIKGTDLLSLVQKDR